jgi:hypothetical protein
MPVYCAIDPALWPSTLEQIAAVLDSAAAALNMLDAVTGTERALVHTGISGQCQDAAFSCVPHQ